MQTFAIIPAAGRSQRMGRPKLLLPWGAKSLIEHVIGTWRDSRVQRVVLVAHPHDAELAHVAASAGAEVVQPAVPPPDMKDSVLAALDHLSASRPAPTDAWLLAPGDVPGLTVATIDRMIDAYAAGLQAGLKGNCVWVPWCKGRRGHPALFPWSLAPEVAGLGEDEGLNALAIRHELQRVDALEDAISADLDTPEDYERWRKR